MNIISQKNKRNIDIINLQNPPLSEQSIFKFRLVIAGAFYLAVNGSW